MPSSKEYRERDIVPRIMSRIHARKNRDKSFNIAQVRRLIAAFDGKSIVSDRGDEITIIPIDRSQPISMTNAMVVHFTEANKSIPDDAKIKARAIIDDILDDTSQDEGSQGI